MVSVLGENVEFGKFCRLAAAYSAAVAVLYLAYGLYEFIVGATSWWMPWIRLPELQLGFPLYANVDREIVAVYVPKVIVDPFAGLVLLVVSLVFAKASVSLFRKRVDGWSFTTVGLLLAGALFVLNVLIVLADWMDAYYPLLWSGEPNSAWSILTDDWMFNPMMILFVLALPLTAVYLKKEEFIREAG